MSTPPGIYRRRDRTAAEPLPGAVLDQWGRAVRCSPWPRPSRRCGAPLAGPDGGAAHRYPTTAAHSVQITTRVHGAGVSRLVTSAPSTRTRPAVMCCSIRSSDSPAAVSRSRTDVGGGPPPHRPLASTNSSTRVVCQMVCRIWSASVPPMTAPQVVQTTVPPRCMLGGRTGGQRAPFGPRSSRAPFRRSPSGAGTAGVRLGDGGAGRGTAPMPGR